MMRNVFVFLAFFLCSNLFSQYTISGTVTDQQGNPLTGANIVIQSLNKGVTTNTQGAYKLLEVPSGDYNLLVSYLGYADAQQLINLSKNTTLNFELTEEVINGEEIIVFSTRAGSTTPTTHTEVSKEDIRANNYGQDLPYLLSLTPSMVVSSDAGAGVGYTGFRIRGTDANRTNVTVNGIPMNDAESHGTFFVNMPDFASSLESVQIQRGVGTSTNGSGAFGATVNMQTNTLTKEAYGELSSAYGSFNTFKNTLKLGTGLLGDHFAFDVRLSKISSDGFIDRAASDLKSFFVSGGYYSEKTVIKVNIFSGQEKTYQAWWGVPKVRLESDLEGMQRYEDHGLYSEEETQHMINSDPRTYNYYTYDNETDNYQQDHYQVFLSQKLGQYFNLNLGLHYTYGRGYYEQYRTGDELSDYGLTPPTVIGETGDTILSTDLVRQKWLDNDFYGTTFSLSFNEGPIQATVGGAWNRYDGRHFGNIIWAQYYGEATKDYEWYRSVGIKTDYNIYAKANYSITSWINIYGDLQYRNIVHEINGIDDDLRDLTQEHTFDFLNPKVGVQLTPLPGHQAYASFSIAHREPNRSNFTDADEGMIPTEEKLNDLELGYNIKQPNYALGATFYYMDYKDQLTLTGEINDVGSAIMVNVDDSYRTGIEIYGGVNILSGLRWDANATFSKNKILNFTEYVDNWDNWETGEQEQTFMEETDIAFSPNFLFTSNIQYSPTNGLSVALISQYVGEQFIDNSSSRERMLDAYFVNNVRINYSLEIKKKYGVEFSLLINNIASAEYQTNAWVYSYIYGDERYAMDGYFPQAGRNYMAGINVSF